MPEKKEPQVRKGKAMLQILTFSSSNTSCNTYHPTDDMRMIMPAADKAEWLINVCLFKAGPSGHLDPGVFARILE
jgi:hypothetical protein